MYKRQNIVFFSQEVNNRIVDLRSVINSYVESETAKFVTGARPISEEEMNKYYEELDKLGYQEYLQYYVDYYQENAVSYTHLFLMHAVPHISL